MLVKSIVVEDAPASPIDIVPAERIVIGVDLVSSQEISITFVGPSGRTVYSALPQPCTTGKT